MRLTVLLILAPAVFAADLTGRVTDLHGKAVAGATVRAARTGGLETALSRTDAQGRYHFTSLPAGACNLMAEVRGFQPVSLSLVLTGDTVTAPDLRFSQLAGAHESIVISAQTLEPGFDLRNAEAFQRTLFSRDDQLLHQLNSGIDAGQHEGGGKSLEVRRFGYNLDHGGVSGGLKVLVDDVQQNQGTQGHGQGYLGSLKALSPELIQEVITINGPFSAEYGDFSGLGVVHIRQRESLPDQYTIRLQGGRFNTGRGFLAFSPDAQRTDAYAAYEGSYTDGPFEHPSRYRRDNVNTNYARTLDDQRKLGVRFLFGRNNFDSSGQIPLDLVDTGLLSRFGALDPTNGGRVKLGTASAYYSHARTNGAVWKADGFVGRSLLDLFSNFTFFLTDPSHGDAFQQHDSRLQEGFNTQFTRPHRLGAAQGVLVTGGNFHDNQINVGLYPRLGLTPTGVAMRAHAHVTNGAGYVQESLSLWQGRVLVGGGVRFDEFRFAISGSPSHNAGRWQGKGSLAVTPARRAPVTLHVNYGRGINSSDARGIVQRPGLPRVATTDFYQGGVSSHLRRLSLSSDVFLIDHSHEQVYVPDDGSFEFRGASRAYGYEAKLSLNLTRRLSLNAGLTRMGNAFYRGGETRMYVDSAPHFVANAALTLAGWRGWSGSLRMRAINHYRLDTEDPSVRATGHTVFDFSLVRRLRRGVEFNLSLDNLTSRRYYETQNYFESRVTPLASIVSRIHATPGFPLTVVAGVTFRLRGK